MPVTPDESGWVVALRSANADTLELGIYDVIGASMFGDGVKAKDVMAKLRSAPKASKIALRVNSIGGIVDEAKAMVNLLNERAASGVEIDGYVDGIAASAASYLLTAASRVTMPANAFMMLHGVRGGVRGDAKDLENAAAIYRRTNDQLAAAYAAASQRRGKSKTKEDYLASFAKGDLYLDASEAVEWGLADEKVEALAVAACLVEIDQLAGAPEALRAAPYATRAESSRVVDETPQLPPKTPAVKPEQDASAVIGGAAKEKPMTMTKDELLKQHPDIYAAVFTEGEAKERKRVLAHIKMGERVSAMKVATKAIADGAAFADDEIQAEYMSAMADRRDTQNRQSDSDTAGSALENAKTPKSNAAGGPPNLIEAAADIYCGKEA